MIARFVAASFALAACSLASCTSFPTLSAGSCGNGVVEAGEDCDGFPNGAASCRPPGAEGACRFDCSDDRRTCPRGYGCGTDSICRASSGQFTAGPHFAAPGTTSLMHGDFDGDGRADLVAETISDLRVVYFGSQLAIAQTTTVPMGRSHAVPALLSDPPTPPDRGLDDLVLATSGGVGVWHGSTDRALTPIVYPSFAVPGGEHVMIPLDAVAKTPGQEMLVLGATTSTTGTIFEVDQRNNPDPPQLFATDHLPHDVAGTPQVGRYAEDPAQVPCDQLALAFKGDTKVHILSPCHADGSLNVLTLPPQLTFPDVSVPGQGTITAVFATTLNKDAHVDLLIDTTAGVFAAFGVGDGTFNSAATLPPLGTPADNAAARYPVVVTNDKLNAIAGSILAAGDLNGDGYADLVYPTGIVFNNGAGQNRFFVSLYASAPWSEAKIADVNGNGWNDVVAVSDATINFYSGNGTPVFAANTYSADGAVSNVAIGDVDGDTVNDVVFRQPASDENGNLVTNEDDLTIMFGTPGGGFPEQPAIIGTLPSIVEITIAPLEPSLVSPFQAASAIGDIAVLTEDNSSTTPQQLVAAFVGRADRELTSPFYLVDGSNMSVQSAVVTRFATGHFTQTDHEDVAVLAGDSNKLPITTGRLWLVPTSGDADVSTSSIHGSDYLPSAYDYAMARMVAVDLKGMGTDSVVMIVPPAKATDEGAMIIAGQSGVTKQISLGAGDVAGKTWVVRQGDVDADGTPDVAALFAQRGASGVTYTVRVMWNRHTGDLDPAKGADVPLPADAPPLGFALANLDADPALEVVVVTAKGVFASKLDAGGTSFGAATPIAGVPTGAGVTSADFDGDGVADLAIGTTGGVDLVRGVPTIE